MSDPSVPAIQAWKKHFGQMSPCDINDPNACQFDIRYYAHAVGWATEVTVDSLYTAERVQSAMMNHYISGRKAAMADLRQLIGAKDK